MDVKGGVVMKKNKGKKKILVIDDEEDLTYFLKKNLESFGDFMIEVCCDSLQAIDMIKSFSPDMIILDEMMPGRSGSDIVLEMKNDEALKNIPYMFLTAVVTPAETDKNGNVIGGEYFVAKPVRIEELVRIIKALAQ